MRRRQFLPVLKLSSGQERKSNLRPVFRSVAICRRLFDLLLKEKPGPAWTEMQAGDELKKAVDLAKNSDIAVIVLGENQDMSGEYASRSTIDLPGRQLEL